MTMQIVNLVQGSAEWKAYRFEKRNASEAAIMLGLDTKNGTRDELLAMKKYGMEKEFSEWVEKHILENGHALEDAQRQIIESENDTELYPITGYDSDNQLLSASLDGADLLITWIYEHKQWNQELADYINEHNDLPETHWPQLEQQLHVSKAKFVKFVVSDGTTDKRVILDYYSKPERIQLVLDGWDQFEKDLNNYEAPKKHNQPKGNIDAQLPTLVIDIEGGVKNSNLPVFREQALQIIERINTDLTTDQDFADAETMVKFCKKTEESIKQKKQQALEQTADINDLFTTLDNVSEALRKKRLELDKLVKEQKQARKQSIIDDATQKLSDHISRINNGLAPYSIQGVSANFAAAGSGKKKLDSFQAAVNTELANAKIEAANSAKLVEANIKYYFNAVNDTTRHLFADLNSLLMNDQEVFKSIVTARIAEFERNESERKKREELASKEEAQPEQQPEKIQAQAEHYNQVSRLPNVSHQELNQLIDLRLAFESLHYPTTENGAAQMAIREARHHALQAIDSLNSAIEDAEQSIKKAS